MEPRDDKLTRPDKSEYRSNNRLDFTIAVVAGPTISLLLHMPEANRVWGEEAIAAREAFLSTSPCTVLIGAVFIAVPAFFTRELLSVRVASPTGTIALRCIAWFFVVAGLALAGAFTYFLAGVARYFV